MEKCQVSQPWSPDRYLAVLSAAAPKDPASAGSALPVADSLPELSWHSHSSPSSLGYKERKEKVTERSSCAEVLKHRFWSSGGEGRMIQKGERALEVKGGVPSEGCRSHFTGCSLVDALPRR